MKKFSKLDGSPPRRSPPGSLGVAKTKWEWAWSSDDESSEEEGAGKKKKTDSKSSVKEKDANSGRKDRTAASAQNPTALFDEEKKAVKEQAGYAADNSSAYRGKPAVGSDNGEEAMSDEAKKKREEVRVAELELKQLARHLLPKEDVPPIEAPPSKQPPADNTRPSALSTGQRSLARPPSLDNYDNFGGGGGGGSGAGTPASSGTPLGSIPPSNARRYSLPRPPTPPSAHEEPSMPLEDRMPLPDSSSARRFSTANLPPLLQQLSEEAERRTNSNGGMFRAGSGGGMGRAGSGGSAAGTPRPYRMARMNSLVEGELLGLQGRPESGGGSPGRDRRHSSTGMNVLEDFTKRVGGGMLDSLLNQKPLQPLDTQSQGFLRRTSSTPDMANAPLSMRPNLLSGGSVLRRRTSFSQDPTLSDPSGTAAGPGSPMGGFRPKSPEAMRNWRRKSSVTMHDVTEEINQGMELRRLSSAVPGPSRRSEKMNRFEQKYSFAGPEQLESLLDALGLECDDTEQRILLQAFTCHVCDSSIAACTTTSDQIRAVYDAFQLIDADGDGLITLADLKDIASWASDGEGMEFILALLEMIQLRYQGTLTVGDDMEINVKDFVLGFARCLMPDSTEDLTEALDKRAIEYRKIGKLFGMERVQQQFSWTKFWRTFFSDTFAFVAFPLCKLLDLFRKEEDDEVIGVREILTESQWLPVPYTSFESFQIYLMKLWLPSIISGLLYLCVPANTQISLSEVLSPAVIYMVIGTYISTISGYEHPRMVRRRLNPALSADLKMNELQAIFAFRAHTPEGHMVDQINTVADFLFARRFRENSNTGSALAGMLHGLMPAIQRCLYSKKIWGIPGSVVELRAIVAELYFWIAGGYDLIHLLISVPATLISGYLTYRLLFVTCVGFSNDLAFYNRLRLFRAMTQAEPFLRFRARWIRTLAKVPAYQGRKDFLQFLNLQKKDDLVLWCRIRQLLVESYAGFRNKQGDIIVTFMLLSVITLSACIFFFQINAEANKKELSVFDMRARVDVFIFSLLLIIIINLKLSIHALRKSDISLLHKEYYAASMADTSGDDEALKERYQEQGGGGGYPRAATAGSRFAASFVRRKSSIDQGVPTGISSPLGAINKGWGRSTEDVMSSPTSAGGWGRTSSHGAAGAHTPQHQPPPQAKRDHAALPWGVQSRGGDGAAGVGYAAQAGFAVSQLRWPPDRPLTAAGAAQDKASLSRVQNLLEHTARYISEFDRPPRLLSFTVSIHFLRYIFLPLLSPIIAALRTYAYGAAHPHHRHHAAPPPAGSGSAT